jgi:lysophospholipase L1-like esterase
MGDSKTADNGFQATLLHNLESTTNNRPIAQAPAQLATGGWKVADLDSAATAWLAAATDTPDFVLVNIGVNDLGITSQASFEASLGSLLDKINAKWASAKIKVMLPWKRGADSTADAMGNTWIPNVLAGRSSWAAIGGDERIFLKGSNDGNSYTSDGVHPNTSGYALTANVWQQAILFP